jgi:hypothetical protein
MILADLKYLLQTHKALSVHHLAKQLSADPNVIRDMLMLWMEKGKVTKTTTKTCNIKCDKCDPTLMEVYVWVES